MKFFEVCVTALFLAFFAAGCGCGGGGENLPLPVTLVSVEVTPSNPVVARGATQQFTATGVFSDNSTQDITSSVTWSSSDTAVAAISDEPGSKGLATAISGGPTTITAASGNITGSATMTVTTAIMLVSIEVTPPGPNVALGSTQQFTATGTFSDNSTQDITSSVTWSSSDTAVAAISDEPGSKGLAAAIAGGSTTVTAASGNITGSTTMTVSIKPVTLVAIKVTPANPVLSFGQKMQFTATGIYSDTSTKDITISVIWSSSDTRIATISNDPGSKGLATTDHLFGATKIWATLGDIKGYTTLTDP